MVLKRKVRIKLEGGNECQTFYAGAVISGVVEYRSPAADLLRSLTLVFRGVSKVLADTKIKQCEHIELFHHTQVLLPAPLQTVSNQPYEWAFTFHVPHTTGPDRSAGVYADSGNPLFEEHVHHLPPSLDAAQSGSTRIEYHMYAIASRTCINVMGASSSWEEHTVDNIDSVPFMPDVPHVEQRQQSYAQTFAVHPPLKRRFSRRGSSIGDVSQTALHSIQLEVNVPATIILGEMISIQFRDSSRTALAGRTSTGDAAPACYLKAVTLAIMAHTHRRTAKTAHHVGLTEMRRKGLGTGHGAREVSLSSSFQTKRFSTTAIKAWPPSFKSYSIARPYMLEIQAVLVCERQEFTAAFQAPIDAVRVVASEEALQRRQSYALPPPLPFQGPRGEDEELPAYENVAQEGAVISRGRAPPLVPA